MEHFDTQDRVFAGLRPVALAVALAYVVMSPAAEAPLIALGTFAGYSLAMYLVVWPRVARPAFYAVAAGLDLVFVVALMALTGGGQSPFFRALYLWVAVSAFYFGRRAGLAGSLTALAVFLVFHARDGFAGDAWVLAVQAGGMLMHGPLIGSLADRERQRAERLRRAHDELREANRALVEEHAKVIQAEKLSSIGLLAAGVAHEINNPLSGVMGCVKALREGSVPEPRREEYFETVREGLERIRLTVQGLLDFARQRPLAPTELEAGEVVAACVRLVAPLVREKELRVDNRVAPSVRVRADRAQVMQALVNVLLNAVQAVPARGRVAVSARGDNGLVGIAISDEGEGIPQELLHKVCDPFFTTKPPGQGTGLGLAITLGIARAHGGDLQIESKPGRGTTVTLWLPSGGDPS